MIQFVENHPKRFGIMTYWVQHSERTVSRRDYANGFKPKPLDAWYEKVRAALSRSVPCNEWLGYFPTRILKGLKSRAESAFDFNKSVGLPSTIAVALMTTIVRSSAQISSPSKKASA